MNNLYLDTHIDNLIKWADEHAVSRDDGEAGNLACEAYKEYYELRAQNASLLEALETIAKHDGVDTFIAKHLVRIATEAIRKGD